MKVRKLAGKVVYGAAATVIGLTSTTAAAYAGALPESAQNLASAAIGAPTTAEISPMVYAIGPEPVIDPSYPAPPGPTVEPVIDPSYPAPPGPTVEPVIDPSYPAPPGPTVEPVIDPSYPAPPGPTVEPVIDPSFPSAPSATPTSTSTPSSAAKTPTKVKRPSKPNKAPYGACIAYRQGGVNLKSAPYRNLVAAAGGIDKVTAYCNRVIAAKARGTKSSKPAKKFTVSPKTSAGGKVATTRR